MKPRTASASVAKCGMPSSSKARFETSSSPSQTAKTGLRRDALLPVAPDGLGDRLAPLARREASAVGTFSTRTASFSSSARSASRAAA